MNFVTGLNFLFWLLIVGGLIRFVEYKWPDSAIGQALGVIY